MSDHDCTGCWRYNPATDREECLVCGAVRAPDVVPDGGAETIDDLAEGMYGELDTVFARYNDLVRARPDLVVALLINMADGIRSKFSLEAEATRLADRQYCVYVDGDDVAGFLGFERHDDGRIVDSDMPDGMDGEPIEDDPELVPDGGEPATSEQKTLNDRYEVPKDALTQRHQYFHVPGCHRAPDWSQRVTARETYMRALKPCPECDPRRPDPA